MRRGERRRGGEKEGREKERRGQRGREREREGERKRGRRGLLSEYIKDIETTTAKRVNVSEQQSNVSTSRTDQYAEKQQWMLGM